MKKMNMGLPQRRLWEFKGFTICRLLGLAFDEKELIKIFNKFKFSCGQRLSEGELHGALVHNCTAPNPVSKYVEKLLKRRFEPYQNRVGE
ncbi:MAG: hypothetical protein IMY88_01805, partial [Chloroflexi bacterium]|nr:hypothetical protein [Chloroflexota bacterium]